MAESEQQHTERGALSLEALHALVLRHPRWVFGGLVAGLLASLAALAVEAPVYRAKATLILDGERSEGLLGDLAALTSAPIAASEMEILRSRTIAEASVAPPSDAPKAAGAAGAAGGGPSASRAEGARHLGLETRVEDLALQPLRSALGGSLRGRWQPRTRLSAELSVDSDAPAAGARPAAIGVRFVAPDRVRLASDPSGLFRLTGMGGVEAKLVPGQPLRVGGWLLRLRPEGDLTGRAYLVRRVPRHEAVESVLATTRVSETERGSGVIQLVHDDSDPRRAAEVANALCRNYLDRNEQRVDLRASQTVEFIEGQLEAQVELLHEAEREVVALQQASPRTVDVTLTAGATIEKLAEIELGKVRLRLERRSLEQALARLEGGDDEALSRLAIDVADPITQSFVAEIARLRAEYELQERSDTGAFRALLQTREIAIEESLDRLAVELAGARTARGALAEHGALATARLGGAEAPVEPLLAGYLAQLAELEARRDTLIEEATPEHPELALVESRAAALERRLLGLLDERIAGLEQRSRELADQLAAWRGRSGAYPADERGRIAGALAKLHARTATHLASRLAGLETRARLFEDEVARLEGELAELPESERVLADPLRRLEAHTEIVKFLLARQQEAEITKAASVASAEFIDEAVAPLERHSPSIPMRLALGGLAGLVVGLAGSLLAESTRRRVFTSAELEEASGLTVFGAIPDFRRGPCRVRGAAAEFVPLRDAPQSPIAEAYRSLRANLRFALHALDDPRTLAVTSCSPGEGKTTTNIDLALSFAAGERRVLLVDADMRHPSVHRYLRLPLVPGLSSVLSGESDWKECVHRSAVGALDVLCAGALPRSPGDLLDSRACDELLAELREAYDLVVFDVPPALAVADLDGFAARLDAMLLLCKADKVEGRVLSATATRLRHVGANLVGAVLNAVGSSRATTPYGSEYGYGYGYGSDEDRGAPERAAG